MTRVQCSACGASILRETATRNGGLCAPCKGGFRASIESGKRWREEEDEYLRSAERKHWVDLVAQVHDDSRGFATLTLEEKTYFAVASLIGEAFNGGLEQFFFNSSGSMYTEALRGLIELGASEAAGLLKQAKTSLFGSDVVPAEIGRRRAILVSRQTPMVLDRLNEQFWNNGEQLAERLREFARSHVMFDGA